LKNNISHEARLLPPVCVEYGEDFIVKEKEYKKLEKNTDATDLFVLGQRIPKIERYKKPIIYLGKGVSNVDVSAYLKDRGYEGYALFDYKELNEMIHLQKVRKAISKTSILRLTGGEEIPFGVVSSIYDFEKLENDYGVSVRSILFKEFFEEMEKMLKDRQTERDAEDLTDKLINQADKVHMKKEDIKRSVYFYLSVKKMMDYYDCNAFTSSCFELCTTKIPAEKKFVPCLTHTLLKDQGFPSACEEDISVLMAMAVLMYLSGKSSYMGNPAVKDVKDNVLAIHHDVPGMKMHSLDGENSKYEIRNFTEGGWGANIRYDFSQDKGQKVTMARFSPGGKKMLILTGEILRGYQFDRIGCSLGVELKVKNVMDYFHKAGEFGHHLAVVYGDYTQEIKKLGKIMDFEVIEVEGE
jgi:L-fucose isomerase-like protein